MDAKVLADTSVNYFQMQSDWKCNQCGHVGFNGDFKVSYDLEDYRDIIGVITKMKITCPACNQVCEPDWIDALKVDEYVNETVGYQLCPKCGGQGIVSKPPYIPGDVNEWSSTSMSFTCDVCKGGKIISKSTGLPPG